MSTPTRSTRVVTKQIPDGPVEVTDPEIDPNEVRPTPPPAPAPAAAPSPARPRPVPVRLTPTLRSAPLPQTPIPLPTEAPPASSGEEPLPTVSLSDGRKIVILMPQYKSTNPLTLYTLAAVWDRATCGLAVNFGDAFIVHSRNRLAHRFIEETNFEWGLFVDDDMVLPHGNPAWFKRTTGWKDFPDAMAGVHTIERLLSHEKSLVGALYFGRNHRGEGKPMFAEGFHSETVAREARNLKSVRGLRPTAWVGTGCLLVHRSVLESIRDRFTHLRPVDRKDPVRYFSPAPDGALSRIARAREALEKGDIETAKTLLHEAESPASMTNAWSGEDVVFCSRARAVGHVPYVDLGLVCGHVGSAVWGPGNTA